MGGFECSTHRTARGVRLDLVHSTQHDRFVIQDYRRLLAQGINTVREGLRWHLIETAPGCYDFSSVRPMVQAAQELGIQIIWDLCHYGWPDDLDIFKPAFVDRFYRFSLAFAELLAQRGDTAPLVCPVNEISFFAWAGGDQGFISPHARGRGHELKLQLVRAAIAGIEAVWTVNPRTRIVQIDPVINIIADPARPQDRAEVEAYRQAQYQGWDMLTGRMCPELGGKEKYLDLLGVNYYDRNQWVHNQDPLFRKDPLYRPFREILQEVYARYGRTMFVAETGTEDAARPDWFAYVCDEVQAAIAQGVPLVGICLYPIVNHPGWDDDRHCHNGLWDYPGPQGDRPIYAPLAAELQRQRGLFV